MFVRTLIVEKALLALAPARLRTGAYSIATQAARKPRPVAKLLAWVTRNAAP
jgi:hypothetical protein